jgi:hypothetical protein
MQRPDKGWSSREATRMGRVGKAEDLAERTA